MLTSAAPLVSCMACGDTAVSRGGWRLMQCTSVKIRSFKTKAGEELPRGKTFALSGFRHRARLYCYHLRSEQCWRLGFCGLCSTCPSARIPTHLFPLVLLLNILAVIAGLCHSSVLLLFACEHCSWQELQASGSQVVQGRGLECAAICGLPIVRFCFTKPFALGSFK